MTSLSTNIEGIILLPIIAGILLFILPERIKIVKGIISLIIASISLFCAFNIFLSKGIPEVFNIMNLDSIKKICATTGVNEVSKFFDLHIDGLAKLIVILVCFFGFIITLYSLGYIKRNKSIKGYYSMILLTLGAATCTALVDNLVLFIAFWGFLGLTLYKLIKGYDEESSAAAKKTFILIGASDGIMILGIGIIWKMFGNLNISELEINTSFALSNVAFIALLIGSFTKAGAFPFHTWIPDFTKKAPASSSAYLPASLDKLLGIYFMARICHDIFILNEGLKLTILIIGVLTIIIAVMMALIQHNYKRLLGYHAVSQVGYMVIGLGLGTTLGIIGGLLHMLNHALYKSGLFLVAGNVEKQTGKEDLDDLGGLSKTMPISFIAAIIFALSISGIPPLNGFASKWVIYQSIIDFGKEAGLANQLWIVWLALAVIGSALTLASFIKFVSGVFMGRQKENMNTKEVSFVMWAPTLLLALICVGIGVFATNYVVPYLFKPVLGDFTYAGAWNSTFISGLILISILLGALIYLIGNINKFRTDDSFIGGEKNRNQTGFAVTGFYKTIQNAPVLSYFYKWAEKKFFDIYDLSKSLVLRISHLLSEAHDGILSNLAFWVLAGLIVMFIILLI